MLPLALIMKGNAHNVSGSDRSKDQGRTPQKFEYLQQQGIELFPQDGSGVQDDLDALVVSTAVEDSIPDVKAAKDKNVPIIRRAELLAQAFNEAKQRIAVAGTSGKSTVTGMIGFVLQELGKQPTVMNGGVFKNYKGSNPYCSALSGDGQIFVTEADESDGSIALYNPDIAVLNNIALDHKSLSELEELFSAYLSKSKTAILNADHPAVMSLKGKAKAVMTFGVEEPADVRADHIVYRPDGCAFTVQFEDMTAQVNLRLPGAHNIANALAAIAVCLSCHLPLNDICAALSRFEGIWRRLDVTGTKGNVTVIDDFAHNPDKIAASLKTLKHFPGKLHIFFQPHGYGFLKLAWEELAQTFVTYLDDQDSLYMVQPYYAGGTVDRTHDSSDVIARIGEGGINAALMDDRMEVKQSILSGVQEGDRIVIMGARDDTLAEFAQEIYDALP